MPELKIARTIQKMNSFTPRLFFYLLKENDRFWRAFCGLLRGEKTYVGLKNRLNPRYTSLSSISFIRKTPVCVALFHSILNFITFFI